MKLTTGIVGSCLALVLSTTSTSQAADVAFNFEAAAADAVIARPCWFVATVIGAGIFIVALPVAAISNSVDKTARTLVVKPAHATFNRPLGDFSSLD